MIVVKVGGSLYDHPKLGPSLRTYLDSLAPSSVLIVPGGGPFADAVRTVDAVHGLGEAAAHALALWAMNAAGEFLKLITVESPPVAAGRLGSLDLVDAGPFADDPALPHSWAVTSDSIAVRAALVHRASRLILLKSTDIPPGTPWSEAAANGWVDAHFPQIAANAPFPIEVVNFRQRMDDFSRPA